MRSPTLDALLEPGALRVLFQPVWQLEPGGTSRLASAEGLVRGPAGTHFEPADILFDYVRLKHAEPLVDRACLAAVCRASRQLPDNLAFSVNVHAATLSRDPEFLAFLSEEIGASGILPTRLTLEIVEHATRWADAQLHEARAALRHIGTRVALDDVGLEQANYQIILECQPDVLKIDRYFVHGCGRDFHRRAVIESVLLLARRLGADVVAEGIEDALDLEALTALGVPFAQGFLLAAPGPAERMASFGTAAAKHGAGDGVCPPPS